MAWLERELFGAPECPLMYRWKLLDFGRDRGKVMLHWFLPGRAEVHPHDHPRDFWTFVLFGSYLDVSGVGTMASVIDKVRAPTFRRRRAEHTHTTTAGRFGCLTIAVFFRRRRAWGFWDRGEWIPWEKFTERVNRCD